MNALGQAYPIQQNQEVIANSLEPVENLAPLNLIIDMQTVNCIVVFMIFYLSDQDSEL